MRDLSRTKKLGVFGLLVVGATAVLRRTAARAYVDKALQPTGLLIRLSHTLDRKLGWYRLPRPLGLVVLVGLRKLLRRRNLYDTTKIPSLPQPPPVAPDARYRTARTADGTFNDVEQPRMGSAGTRFGRNVPLEDTYPDPMPDILQPNPRTVSLELLTRDAFQPATTINLLAAAWIQFMVRDWFSHGKSPKENPWELPLDAGDPWPDKPMRILRTMPDPTRPEGSDGAPPTHINTETPWWDGSQIYGSDAAFQAKVRTGRDGKLAVGAENPLLADPTSPENPANVPGFWLGLALLHNLFTLEHNAICDQFRTRYPHWSDDEVFDHARLVNAALLAKIHTVEWTPALISHPTTKLAMRANWWGIAGEHLHNLFGRISGSEVISGIPGSKTDHYGIPYSLTEEFVAVYRMHPLIPDDFSFRAVADNRLLNERTFPELTGMHALEVLAQTPMADLLYSFGTSNPGAIQLHNYPRGLQHFIRPDGIPQDLAATDILRTRELGVPRYNRFRELLHLRPASTFEELTDNPVWAEELRRVYGGDVDRVDLVIGLFAEPKPAGFGFSDTAFRIFILMASRRLNSDRFFTNDYTPEVYTQTGLDWIDQNGMASVLLRHYPALQPALRGVENPFAPWTTVGG
ncbi:MAG TPA: peroxidase family protein [Thermomicrobiales bacterium]